MHNNSNINPYSMRRPQANEQKIQRFTPRPQAPSSVRPCIKPRQLVNPPNSLDTHELLKQEIAQQDENQQAGIGDPSDISYASTNSGGTAAAIGPPVTVLESYGFEDVEIYFDSRYRNGTSSLSNGEVEWNLTQLNNNQEVSNIIEIHVGNFFFPKILAPSTAPEFFYFRKVYMELLNSSSRQNILGPNGQRFHFEFDVLNINSQAVMLQPVKTSYFFGQPLNWLATFQIQFWVPQTQIGVDTMKPVPIPNEQVVIQMLTTGGAGYNPIRFQIIGGIDTTAVLGLIGSLGTPGVAVYIADFASNDPAVDAQVNDANGVFATNVIDATTFEIASINGTTVTTNSQALMYVAKNRIAFPFRFTCLRNHATNHLQVAHL